MAIRDIIERLRKESPEALSDSSSFDDNINLSEINDMTPPSEVKRMSEAIRRKRLTASGLTNVELKSLMGRIGRGA